MKEIKSYLLNGRLITWEEGEDMISRTKDTQKDCQGTCPRCGSSKLSFLDSRLEDDSEVFEFECMECEGRAREIYSLKYVKTEYSSP